MYIAIVDDEEIYHIKIKELLNNQTIDSYYNPKIFLESDKKYDFIILDIDMPEINGIDIKNKLIKHNIHSKVIFVTQYKEYMKDAFGLNVLGYVLKSELYKLTDILNDYLSYNRPQIIQIVYQDINIHDILYIQKEELTRIYYKNKVLECTISLTELLDRINNKNFFFIRRNTIINKAYIKVLKKSSIIMKNNIELVIGRTYLKEVKKKVIYDN